MPYESGDRVELVHTSDPYTKLESGERGTVTGVDTLTFAEPPETQVWVEWDSGSKLAMILGEDRIRKVNDG